MSNTNMPIFDLPFEKYQAIEAINASAIVAGRTSMLHMRHEMTREIDEPTPAMRWGHIVHCAILEPCRFEETHSIWHGKTRRGGAWDECIAAAQDERLIVTPAELDKIRAMQDRIYANKYAAELIDETEHEVTFTWDDMVYGAGKARLDMYRPNTNHCGGVIADYKTTKSIEPGAFWKTAYNLAYHVRMGWYVHGVERATGERLPVMLIVQESSAPFDCWVCRIPSTIIEVGEKEAANNAVAYKIAQTIGLYYGAVEAVIEYELPAWAMGGENAEVNMEGLE